MRLTNDDQILLAASANATATDAYLVNARRITITIPDSITVSDLNLDVNNSAIVEENAAITNPLMYGLLSLSGQVANEANAVVSDFDDNWTSASSFNEHFFQMDGPFRFIRLRKSTALPSGFKAFVFAEPL